jgi:hypothetical protein
VKLGCCLIVNSAFAHAKHPTTESEATSRSATREVGKDFDARIEQPRVSS